VSHEQKTYLLFSQNLLIIADVDEFHQPALLWSSDHIIFVSRRVTVLSNSLDETIKLNHLEESIACQETVTLGNSDDANGARLLVRVKQLLARIVVLHRWVILQHNNNLYETQNKTYCGCPDELLILVCRTLCHARG